MDHCLLEKRDDGIALITLNRPERLNAISPELFELLSGFLADCEADVAVRCVAITGAGRAFCAGIDLSGLGTGPTVGNGPLTDLTARVEYTRRRHEAVALRLHTMPKPTVAIVNGHAIGAGLSFALACDIRLVGPAASFATGYARMGLSGDHGGTYFLTKLVGSGIARELCFTGEAVDATRAAALGIANQVFPQETLLDASLAFCQKLAQGPTAIYGRMKDNLNAAWTATTQEALDREAMNIAMSRLGNDAAEAGRAVREKRPPKFSGT